ncbi:MAG: c-type cytochrome [Deltaproteobacteria bacterium]|nr:c-type cytochrome [Deltaproteobacteria bacterium]
MAACASACACAFDSAGVPAGDGSTAASTTSGGTVDGAEGADGSSGTQPRPPGDLGGGVDAGTPWAPWAQGHPIPPGPPVDGDAAAGRAALLENGYVSCGIPWVVFPLLQPFLGGMASEPPLPGRTGANAMVPYNWTVHTNAAGVEITSLNCLECHVGRFDGELVLGLGSADVDYTGNAGATLAGLPVPQIDIPGIEELLRFAQRYQVLGPEIVMHTVGTNPADEVAAVLAAHRDRDTLAWSDAPLAEVPDLVAPVDTPPWWRTKKKHGLFYNGMARGDHRGTMMFASSLCTDTIDEAEAILDYFDDVRAFIATIEAPVYPFAIDASLADAGAEVFTANCAGCHGTYGDAGSDDDDTYPNLIFDVDFVGTDPLIAEYAASTPLVDWFNGSIYGAVTQLVVDDPVVGYVAPPLDGIWATAPYLHNGSVPSLALVLDSAARPTQWQRVDHDTRNFDELALGWPWFTPSTGWDDAPPEVRKHIYDTTKQGHGNGGHDFGDHLSDDERRAVLEYLKTL